MFRTSLLLAFCVLELAWPGRASAQDNPFASCKLVSTVNSLGQTTEPIPERPGSQRLVRAGDVAIVCDDTSLYADQVTWERDTGQIVAKGQVSFQQRDLVIYAERAELNSETKFGTFFNASGSARIGDQPAQRDRFGTMEPDVTFTGEEISRTGPTTYVIKGGGFSTCAQPTPRWQLTGSRGTIVLDKRVFMRNVVLKVKDVPMFYLPAIYYPINKEGRSTGFLLPTYGSSTVQGPSLSNAFFWAINRSQDATLYHDWYTKSGQGMGGEYRYRGTAGSQARGNFYTLGEHTPASSAVDPDALSESHRNYQLDGNANQALPRNFRLFGGINYFTDAGTQQRYQSIDAYSRRDRSFSATVTGAIGRFRLMAIGEQRDYFYGTAQGQRSGRMPGISLGLGDKPIGRSKIYVGLNTEAAYFVRQDDVTRPETNHSLWRFDANPTVRAPLSNLSFLSATGAASWRVTRWLETLDPEGNQVPVALTRQLLEMRAQVVGPVFSRIFQTPDNGYADRFKHLIEPGFSIQRTTAFDQFDRIIKNDYSVDSLVGGVTTINYRLTNRLLARRHGAPRLPGAPASPGIAREILSVDLSQTYYSDALAAAYDPEYQSGASTNTAAKGTFSAIQLTAVARPSDEGSVQFRMDIDSKYHAVRTMNASGSLDAPWAQVTAGWSARRVVKELPGFEVGSQFLNALTTIRTPDNRLGGTYALNLDVSNRSVLQQRIVASYNSQCCGVSFDWQTIKTPLLNYAADRRFGISFTLAGVGTFSNPFGSFGGGR